MITQTRLECDNADDFRLIDWKRSAAAAFPGQRVIEMQRVGNGMNITLADASQYVLDADLVHLIKRYGIDRVKQTIAAADALGIFPHGLPATPEELAAAAAA